MRELRKKAGELVTEMKFGDAIQITQCKQNVKVLITQDFFLHLMKVGNVPQSIQEPPVQPTTIQPLVEKEEVRPIPSLPPIQPLVENKQPAHVERVKITDIRYKVVEEREKDVDIAILLHPGDESKGIEKVVLNKTITFGVYCMIKNGHEEHKKPIPFLHCVGDIAEENLCPYGSRNKIFT